MIIGVFVSWASTDLGSWGGTESVSGWTIATDDDGEMFSYNYAPLVALVCGIISLIAMIVPMVLPAKNIGKMLWACRTDPCNRGADTHSTVLQRLR